MQGSQHSNNQDEWCISNNPSESRVEQHITPGNSMASDGGLLVSVVNNVRAVNSRSDENPDFDPSVDLVAEEFDTDIDASQATAIAIQFDSAAEDLLKDHQHIEKIHILMAVPAGLAFLMGQTVNSLPDIQLYELKTSNGPKRYTASALLSDSH